jgi:hypothetical protein
MSRKSNYRRTMVIGCLSLLVLSCAGSQPAATAPAPSVAPSAAPAPAPAPTPSTPPVSSAAPAPSATEAPPAKVTWKDMKADQRKDYMKTVVLPKMKEEFIGFNAKKYSEMNCVTCHGDSVKDGSFKMPNPKLPKLPSDEAGFKALMKKKPDVTKFMGGKVVPAMAEMLGESPYDPATKQGFGCFECHTKK